MLSVILCTTIFSRSYLFLKTTTVVIGPREHYVIITGFSHFTLKLTRTFLKRPMANIAYLIA